MSPDDAQEIADNITGYTRAVMFGGAKWKGLITCPEP